MPWVWGSFYLASNGPVPRPALWVQPGGAEFLAGLGERLGFPDMFERTFNLSEYAAERTFTIGGLVVTPTRVPHYTLETYAFRVQSNGAACSRTRETPLRAPELVEAARDADLFVCEATLLRGELDGEPRGHLSLDEAVEAFEESGASGFSSRTARASSRLPTSSSSRTTGSSSRSDASAGAEGSRPGRPIPSVT